MPYLENEFNFFLGVAAGLVAYTAYILYIISIVRGITKPSRVTWWLWSILSTIVAVTYFLGGAKDTVWVPIMDAVGPMTIAVLSIKYGEGNWNKFDSVCLIGSVLTLLFWFISKSPVVATVCGLIISGVAYVPTIIKSYINPRSENFFAWCLTTIGDTMNIIAIEKFVFAIAFYPLYALALDGLIVCLILLGSFKHKSAFSPNT